MTIRECLAWSPISPLKGGQHAGLRYGSTGHDSRRHRICGGAQFITERRNGIQDRGRTAVATFGCNVLLSGTGVALAGFPTAILAARDDRPRAVPALPTRSRLSRHGHGIKVWLPSPLEGSALDLHTPAPAGAFLPRTRHRPTAIHQRVPPRAAIGHATNGGHPPSSMPEPSQTMVGYHGDDYAATMGLVRRTTRARTARRERGSAGMARSFRRCRDRSIAAARQHHRRGREPCCYCGPPSHRDGGMKAATHRRPSWGRLRACWQRRVGTEQIIGAELQILHRRCSYSS